MTPELTLQPDNSRRTPMGAGHLTEEQFGELIAASALANSPAEAHLRSCEQCAAELASLRECLTIFREASTAYANNELRRIPQVKLPAHRPLFFPLHAPMYWAAAAALLLAALLPLQTLRRHSARPVPVTVAGATSTQTPTESDETLLDDVDRDGSAAVPTAMQALVDPTGAASTSSGAATSTQTSN